MTPLFRFLFRRLRILSLDVVLGAIASGSMVVHLLTLDMPVFWWLALPMSVWVIYTADHLLDAYRIGDQAHTERHLFHHVHFRPIALIWGALLLSCLTWIPWNLPIEMIFFGLGMGACVMIHLTLVSWVGGRISRLLQKELGVGLIYTAGVWGGPLSLFDSIPPGLWILCLQFFLLAMFNLLLFSMYEIQSDELDGHTSFVRAIGVGRTRQVLIGLASAILLLMAGSLWMSISKETLAVQGIYLAMLSLFLVLMQFPQYFEAGEKYRIWGDAAFLLPALIWLL